MRILLLAFSLLCSVIVAYGQKKQRGRVDSVTVYPSPVISYKVVDGDSFALIIPGPQYKAGPLKNIFAGAHYRKAWNTPVLLPVLQTEKEKGGLTYNRSGGNKQTIVVNMENKNKEVFTVRTIQKNNVKALPMDMRSPIVASVARDQASSMHPTAMLVIPKLADALGIIHTNPKLFYVSSDTAFREAQSLMAGRIVMIEERYEGTFYLQGFTGPVKSFKTDKAIEEIEKDPTIRVDQRNLLRARYLDMIIGDWDRSEDQWKWLLKVNPDSSKILKPVPRDRDQAMVLMDGVFPWFYSQEFISRKYQGFRTRVHDKIGLNWNARTFDRRFLNELTKEDWLEIADSVKLLLTDEVITKAINDMPEAHRELDGDEIVRKIKARRDALKSLADGYYKQIAEDVNVYGSAGDDYFKVTRFKDDSMLVRMFTRTDTLHPVYSRIIKSQDTDDVIIYANKGNDKIFLEGKSKDKIVIRFIGGDGTDTIIDRSEVDGIGRNTIIYDLKNDTKIDPSKETKDFTSYDIRVNENTYEEYTYDSYMPKIIFAYNNDQGILAGVGFDYTHEEFRKKPYGFFQEINYAQSITKKGYYITTKTNFVNMFGKWGLQIDNFLFPSFITSFYGFGNETRAVNPELDFNNVRMNRTYISPMFYRAINEKVKVSLGGEYSRHTAFPDRGRYIRFVLRNRELHQQFFTLKVEYEFRNDDYFNKNAGFVWKTFGQWKYALTENTSNFSRIGTDASAYLRLKTSLHPVIATRVGGVTNFDAFPFYESAFIGGFNFEKENETVRGFRRNRFAGRSCMFNNNEIRFRLVTFGYSGEGGVFGFYDVGRVWADGEESTVWHSGKGGGLWLKPMKKLMVTLTYANSIEDDLITVDMGFFF